MSKTLKLILIVPYYIVMIVKEEQNRKSREQLVSELKELRKWSEKLELLSSEYEHSNRTMRSFEKAFETMQIGVTITDLKGKILYINSAELAMHGYSKEDLEGKNVRIFAPTDSWKTLDVDQIKKMKRWKRESINKRKDGSTFPVQLMSDVVTDVDDENICIITTCEDITERKTMEAEIKTRIDELEKFYEMSVGREVKMKELKREIKRLQVASQKDKNSSH